MINRVEINIPSYELVIDNDSCVINGKRVNIKDDDVDNIVRIIRNWNNNYYNDKVIGEDEWFIRLVYNNRDYVYRFNSSYPDDFSLLVNYVGEMYDRDK